MNPDEKNSQNDPNTVFNTVKIFDSFEEEAEYMAKQRAAMSYDERMKNIEELRKRVFHQYLLPNGDWPPISKKFKIMEPHVSETGK